MGHYAKVYEGKVQEVIVAKKDFFDTFVDNIPGEWIKTSYNTHGGVYYDPSESGDDHLKNIANDQSKALRYNFASVGFNYDSEADAFYAPQPFPSWILNTETYLWEPPVDYPIDSNRVYYLWNEENQSWDLIE
jgi:hypothetical protein